MIRKSTGTPFKLKGAPFKEDGDPKGSTRTSENLGDYATDEGHLVNVTKNTLVTPGYDGGPAPEARRGGRKYKGKDFIGEVLMKSDRFKGLSGQAMADAGHISKSKIGDWDERTGYKPSEGKKVVDYETEEKPNPGTPGGTMDSFTSAEGRDLSRLARNTANAAVRDSKKLKKAEDGTLFGRLFTKKGREKGRKAKEDHQARKIAIRKAEAEAGAKQAANAGIQQSTGTNTWTTTDKMQNGEGTPGTSFTIAPENTRRFSDLVKGNNSNNSSNSGSSFAELGSRLKDMQEFKLETPTIEDLTRSATRYGRDKSSTPFKLNKYKK
jgi:hypothetical protein